MNKKLEVIKKIYELINANLKCNWTAKLKHDDIIWFSNSDIKTGFGITFRDYFSNINSKTFSKSQLITFNFIYNRGCIFSSFIKEIKISNPRNVFLVTDSLVPNYISEFAIVLTEKFYSYYIEKQNKIISDLQIPNNFKIEIDYISK